MINRRKQRSFYSPIVNQTSSAPQTRGAVSVGAKKISEYERKKREISRNLFIASWVIGVLVLGYDIVRRTFHID